MITSLCFDFMIAAAENLLAWSISKIRMNSPDKAVSTPMDLPTNVRYLSNFVKTTADEIRQIKLSHGIKCSPEDPVPANLLKTNWTCSFQSGLS